MKFGIHNPSFVFGSDPAEAFEGLKTKALWAETHGFTSLSVMDHLTQILRSVSRTNPSSKAGPRCPHWQLLPIAFALPRWRPRSPIAIPLTWPRSPPALT